MCTYKTPGELADMADTGAWDIGLIGAEPQRAEKIAFTAGLCRDRGNVSGAGGLALKAIADVDRAGVRIAVTGRSAYGLWLDRNIKTRPTGAVGHARQRLRAVRWPTSLTRSPACRPRLLSDVEKAARRAYSRRPVHGRAAGLWERRAGSQRGGRLSAQLRVWPEVKASGVCRPLDRQAQRCSLCALPPEPRH